MPLLIMNLIFTFCAVMIFKIGIALRFQLFINVLGIGQQICASDLITLWHTEVLDCSQCTAGASQSKFLHGWSSYWISPVDGSASVV